MPRYDQVPLGGDSAEFTYLDDTVLDRYAGGASSGPAIRETAAWPADPRRPRHRDSGGGWLSALSAWFGR